jgi:hypothetical protein
MIFNRQFMLGKMLTAVGCLWLFLILFHIKPLFLSLFFFGVWLKASIGFAEMLTFVNGGEYLAALATVASGLTVWRRGAAGRWPLKMIFVVLALFIVGAGARFAIKKRAAQKREAAYQSILSEYQRALKPGMTRKEVEDYLRAKNAQFRKSNFAESGPNRHSFDDLTKIGEEDAPWFCSEHNIYVAFYFVDHESSSAPGFMFKDDDLDTLKSVSLYHWLEGCL